MTIVPAYDWFPIPVPENVTFGDGSYLYSAYAFLQFHSRSPAAVRVGVQTGIYEGTQFNLGPDGEVAIGNFGTVVSTIFSTNGRVSIGDFVMFAYGVVVADDAIAIPGTIPAGPPAATITIGDNVWIGARSVLLPGAKIGDDAVIGAGSIVDFAVPPAVVVAGNPARVVTRLRG